MVFTTLTCITTTCGIATAVWMVTGAPLPAIGAALAAISLALLEAAPPISVMLARLSTHRTPETPLTKPDQLDARAIRAHTWLTSLAAAFCASAALGALGAAAGPSLRGIMLAVVTGSLLLSRARTHQDIGRAVPHLVGGSVTLGGVLVASAAAYPHLALYVASLSMAFGFLALYLGFAGRMKVVSPAGRRITELVEYFAFATVVPLAVWLCGIYAAARSVNLP